MRYCVHWRSWEVNGEAGASDWWGRTPSRPKSLRLGRLSGSDCECRFSGLEPRIPELLNAFDVYVLSSLNEGISNSLLEAMASGLPVIATAVGGNPEVVIDGGSGLLFPAGDSIARELPYTVATDPQLRARGSRQQARRRVREEFSIDSMVRKYEEVYEGLTARLPGDLPSRCNSCAESAASSNLATKPTIDCAT